MKQFGDSHLGHPVMIKCPVWQYVLVWGFKEAYNTLYLKQKGHLKLYYDE